MTAEDISKNRYSDKELSEFQSLIEEKLTKANGQLQYYLKQLSETSDNADSKIKGLDDGLTTIENERLISMASRQKKLIRHLESAILRIKSKTYGICRQSGKLISRERLRAVPHATLSIAAKQGRNK